MTSLRLGAMLSGLLVGVGACGGNVVVDATSTAHGGAAGTGGRSSSGVVVASSASSSSSSSSSGGSCASGTCALVAGGPCETPSGPQGNGCCKCGANGICAAFCECAAPDTPIATPSGERPIASLRVGDLVYSVDHQTTVVAPILAIHRTAVAANHRVVRVRLANGATLDVSAGHPTLDGRVFGDLRAGGELGGVGILEVERVPYGYDRTFDVLPASDTGGYFAAGVLIGSTLRPAARVER